VVFYGGEPLVARDQLLAQARVFREALCEASVSCELGLITNGTRLDQWTAVRLARAGFTRVSVTLAGTCDQHDARRKVPDGTSYRLILDNLDAARWLLDVRVRYELREDMDLVRLPEFVVDLQARGLLGADRPVKVVTQPPCGYARQARALFAPDRPRAIEGNCLRWEGDPI
jgi:sulfatase maturation enzyme AslB (radical SAM superfamily)